MTPQSQGLLRQVLSSLSLKKIAEQPTLPHKKVRIQGGKDSKKYLLIPELDPLKTIPEINLMKLKFFKKLIAVAEKKNLNQFF